MACVKRYGDSAHFVVTFNPDIQYQCAGNLQRTFMGSAPTLGVVSEAYGQNITETWLAIQIRDLSEFSGCKDKLTTKQIDTMVRTICTVFPYLKVTELAYFFLLFKSGKYGKFYGAVDGLAITEALQDFLAERREIINKYEQEEREREKEIEEARHAERVEAFHAMLRSYGITIKQWLANRDVFDNNTDPAQIKAELDKRLKRNQKSETKNK